MTLNVLYQSNDYYAPITGVSITSLFENNKHIDQVKIYILNDNISNENINKLKMLCETYKRELILIDTEDILKKLKELKVSPFKNTYTTYFKLMAIKNLNVTSGIILQLDGDTVINGPLDELCNIDLSNHLMAATYDCTLNKYKRLIGIPEHDKYYNCGVLLINQNKWVELECEEKIVNHLKNVRSGYYTVDQDILNVLFRKEIKYLNLKYNFNSGFYIFGINESLKMYALKPDYYHTFEDIRNEYNSPTIYHCMGAMTGRPWEIDSIHPQNSIFDKYINMSPWRNFEKIKVKRKFIFRMQRKLYIILPKVLYIPIHRLAQMYYFKQMDKLVQSKN